MKRLLLTRTIGVLIFLLCATIMHAQSITVTGNVADEFDNNPLPGVNVIVQGTQNGTITDLDGNFTITTEVGKVLEITMIGYLTETVTISSDQAAINVLMVQDIAQLDEVVVIGYGTQRKVDLTGSVAIVDAEELQKVSNSNISTMLQGKASGVRITTDGQPGADPSVRIRGIGSFTNTDPLYIIDGVPMGSTIRDFSPNDIESLQILKDASAAAIYGSRAANGVVIITTKQGKKNQPMKIDYRGYFGTDQVQKDVYEVMDATQYGEYLGMSYGNSDVALPSGYDPTSSKYLDPSVINTNWFDEAFKTGVRQNHNVNLSGGGENNTYNIALDYFSQEGTIEGAGPNFDRYTARINNSMDVKFLKFNTSVVYSYSDQDNMALSNANEYVQGLYGAQFPVMASVLLLPPSIKAYDESTWVLDDKISAASDYNYDSYGYGTYYDDVHGDLRVTNVLLTNNLLERNSKVNRMVATGSVNADLLDMLGAKNNNYSLNYKLNVSYNKTSVKAFTFIPAFIQSTTNYLSKNNETLIQEGRDIGGALMENTLNFDGNFGKNHLNVLVGHTFERTSRHTLTGTGTNMPEPYYLQVNNATETKAATYDEEAFLESYLGRLIYDYDQKYLFSATVRQDASSRLTFVDNTDIFPSVSAGWRIEKEDFFPVDKALVNLFKVRGSYGVLGVQNIGPYEYMDVMPRGDYTYSFDNSKVNGSAVSNYVNEFIKWEKKKTLDFGLDISMFSNKLDFTMDWYEATSEDLLYLVQVPQNAGVTNADVRMNAATMVNTGFEFLLAYRNHDNALKYDLTANVSTISNEVIKLGVNDAPQTNGFSRTEVGQEVGQFYGYVLEDDDGTNIINGIAQNQSIIDTRTNENDQTINQNGAQAGDILYKDLNNDGEITSLDQEYLGSGLPDVTFGFDAYVAYNGFDLSIATNGAAGFKAVDFVDMELHRSYGATNKSVDLLEAWTPGNTDTDIPRVSYKPAGSITNDFFSERFIQNASYLKIANIELGYNFSDELFNDYVHGVRLYVSAQNIATISKYKGYNVDFAGGLFTPGYNYASYPTPRSMMVGVHFSF